MTATPEEDSQLWTHVPSPGEQEADPYATLVPGMKPANHPVYSSWRKRAAVLLERTATGIDKKALLRALEASRRPHHDTPAPELPSAIFRPPTVLHVARPRGLAAAFFSAFAPATLLATLAVGAILAVALWLLEALPYVGLPAFALALAFLGAVRLQRVRDAAYGRAGLAWPDAVLAAVPLHVGAWLVFVPALALGVVASDDVSWAPGLARRVFAGRAGEAMAREILDSTAPDAPGRVVLTDVAATGSPGESALQGLSTLTRVFLEPRNATGTAARVAFFAALFLFPMALLAATLFESAYAPLNLVLVLRSIARAPFAYGIVTVVFFLGDVLLLAASLAVGSTLGHVVGLIAFSTLLAWVSVATASVLGAFHARHAHGLGW